MKKTLLPFFAIAMLLSRFDIPVVATFQGKDADWIRSFKADDIEIFYQTEKVGSENYEVKIKVVNNRSKAIRVWTRIKNKFDSSLPDLNFPPNTPFVKNTKAYGDKCELIVPAQGSTICEGIKVSRQKIESVNLTRWINEDIAQEEDKKKKNTKVPWKN